MSSVHEPFIVSSLLAKEIMDEIVIPRPAEIENEREIIIAVDAFGSGRRKQEIQVTRASFGFIISMVKNLSSRKSLPDSQSTFIS